MKLSKLFHCLYASLMFLPLLVIPIFAIYVRNESNTFENNITLEVEQNKVVDFNQIVPSRTFTSDSTVYQGITFTCDEYKYALNGTKINGNQTYSLVSSSSFIDNHKYLYKSIPSMSWSSHVLYFNVGSKSYTSQVGIFQYSIAGAIGNLTLNVIDGAIFNNYSFYFNCFDLTQMFGVGNEPSEAEFIQWYPNDYYDYTLSETQLLKNYSVETLNNTDIGSQFLYSVYKPVNDYFNIKDWMNLGGLYDWFLLNTFNGSNSIVIPIIFNLIIYWLVVSFIWLIFDVLMYVPNMIHKMLDKARME